MGKLLCGPRTYTIKSVKNLADMSILASYPFLKIEMGTAPDGATTLIPHDLVLMTDVFADEGVYEVVIEGSLDLYPEVASVETTFTAAIETCRLVSVDMVPIPTKLYTVFQPGASVDYVFV